MAVYFENISYEIRKILRSATKKIVICVAWIDFDIYYQELENALNRGVLVRILVTRSDKVKSNSLYISNLQQKGVVFEVIVLGRAINCMHNKIAIIDDAIVITGSYNWTHNAESNYENVFIDTRNEIDIMSYYYEIDRISKINCLGIAELTKTGKCPYCGSLMMNALIYDENKIGNLIKMCSFDTGHYINTGEQMGAYLPDIINAISYEEEFVIQHMDFDESLDIIKKEYEIKRMEATDDYIWSLKIPIHAVGVVSISKDYFFAGEKMIKMIWFNKSYAGKFEDEYYDSFDVF